jgi:hypothetical protein
MSMLNKFVSPELRIKPKKNKSSKGSRKSGMSTQRNNIVAAAKTSVASLSISKAGAIAQSGGGVP